MLAHGFGGSGSNQTGLWASSTDPRGMVVVALYESGPNEGYRHTERERQITHSAIRWCKRHLRIDDDRFNLGGTSSGGHLTWQVATRDPTTFAGLIPMIGGPRLNPGDGQNNLRFIESVAHLPIRDLQGARVEARIVARGAIEAESRLVRRLRIYVVEEMLDEDGRLRVTHNGKARRFTPKAGSRVLLEEFVTRVDRGFLPIATVEIR